MANTIKKNIDIVVNVVGKVTSQVTGIVNGLKRVQTGAVKAAGGIGVLNSRIDKIKNPAGLAKMADSIDKLSGLKAGSIGTIVKNLRKLDGMKFPKFKTASLDIVKHIRKVNSLSKAYKNLGITMRTVKFGNLNTALRQTQTATDKSGKSTKKSTNLISRWGFAIGSASSGLSQLNSRLYGISRGFAAIGASITSMAALSTIFASLFALKSIITDLVKFDDAIRRAGAVAQASATQMYMLEEAARAMGETTRYTATDAADALSALAMTGLDVYDSIAALPTVMNVAAAAQMSMGKSADILTNIMVGYGKEVSDLPVIADAMAAAFTSSNTTLEQIGVALQYVGPIAKAAGQRFMETTGILASLANAGYRASKAGTILRTSISRLLAPTRGMKKVMASLGVSMSDLVKKDGTLNSFAGILDILRQKGITAGDAMTLFGKRAGPGILSLLGQGKAGIDKMIRAMENSAGLSAKVAHDMEKGIGGSLRRLRSLWEELKIAIGRAVESDIKDIVDSLTKSLAENKDALVDTVKSFFQFGLWITKVTVAITAFAAKNAGLLGTLAGIATAFKLASVTAGMFGGKGLLAGIAAGLYGIETAALGALAALTPFTVTAGILIATVGGLAAAIYLTYESFEDMAGRQSDMADSFSKTSKDIEYQANELDRLKTLLEQGDEEEYAEAQEHLRDVLAETSLAAAERYEILDKVNRKTDDSIEVIGNLVEALDKEAKTADSNALKQSVKARENIAKAIDEQAVKLKRYYGIQVDGASAGAKEIIQHEKRAWWLSQTVDWYGKLFSSKQKEIEQYEALRKEQGVINSQFAILRDRIVNASGSAEDLVEQLMNTGATDKDIEKAVKEFEWLNKEVEKGTITMENFGKLTSAQLENAAEKSKILTDIYKIAREEREAKLKESLFRIEALEAQGVLTKQKAEYAKLQAVIKAADAEVAAARKTYESIKEMQGGDTSTAAENLLKAEKKAAEARLKILQNLASKREALESKTAANIKKFRENTVKFSQKLAERIIKIEKKVKDEIEKLEKKKVSIKQKSAAAIARINMSTEDKIRAINQRSMTDAQKETSNRLAAQNKLAKGLELVAEGQRSLNEEALDRGADLISQAQDIFAELGNQASGVMTVKEATKALAEANKSMMEADKEGRKQAAKDVKEAQANLIKAKADQLKAIQGQQKAIEGVQKAEQALINTELARKEIQEKLADQSTDAIVKPLNEAKRVIETNMTDEVRKQKEVIDQKTSQYNSAAAKEVAVAIDAHNQKQALLTAEIEGQKKKIEWIEYEQSLVADIIRARAEASQVGDTNLFGQAQESADEAIKAVDEFSKALGEISDREIITTFKGKNSSVLPFSEKVDELVEKARDLEINDLEIVVNFKDKSQQPISDRMTEIRSEIESIEVTIPLGIGDEELQAVLDVITEMNRAGINVQVNPMDDEFNRFAELLKSMTDSPMVIKINVVMTELLRAKKIYDEIKDKTITVKVKQQTVEARATGGLVGSLQPERYAEGGNVFRRLADRHITKGSGLKDDVPALLKKNEFVHKVSAVRKYGVDFMRKLNLGLIPKGIVQLFDSGGVVKPIQEMAGSSLFNGNAIQSSGIPKISVKAPDAGLTLKDFGSIKINTGDKEFPALVHRDVASELRTRIRRESLVGVNR